MFLDLKNWFSSTFPIERSSRPTQLVQGEHGPAIGTANTGPNTTSDHASLQVDQGCRKLATLATCGRTSENPSVHRAPGKEKKGGKGKKKKEKGREKEGRKEGRKEKKEEKRKGKRKKERKRGEKYLLYLI
jgi:hypothetical protein